MEEKKQNNIPDDEIDFGPVVNWMGSRYKNLKRKTSSSLEVLRSEKKIIYGLSLLGLLLGFALYFLAPPVYKSEIIVVSRGYSSQFNYEKIAILNKLIDDKSFSSVADILNLSQTDASKLKSIDYAHLDPNQTIKDTLINNLFFTVTVEVEEINMLDSLQKRLLNYLDENAFAKQNKELQVKKLNKMITKLEKDITAIDSLKNQLVLTNIPGAEKGGFVFGEPLDPIDFYREANAMYERKLDLEIVIDTIDNIQLVSGFQKYTKPIFPRFRHVLFCMLGGFVLSIIYILAFRKNKAL